jgi:hypothetical protein
MWDLAWAGDGAATCASAGVTDVDLDMLNTFTGRADSFTFACADYQGTSPLLPVDEYTVALRAYDAYSTLLSEWPTPPNVFVSQIYSGSVTRLPDVMFVIQP